MRRPLTVYATGHAALAAIKDDAEYAGLWSANRIHTGDDAIDQRRDGCVQFNVGFCCSFCILMRGRSVLENAHDLAFREDLGIVEREKQGLANRKCGYSGLDVMIRHWETLLGPCACRLLLGAADSFSEYLLRWTDLHQ